MKIQHKPASSTTRLIFVITVLLFSFIMGGIQEIKKKQQYKETKAMYESVLAEKLKNGNK